MYLTGCPRTTQVIVCNHTAPQMASIGGDIYVVLRVRAGIVLYIVPLDSGGNHNASPRREGLERRNLASRSLLRAWFGPTNVEFRGGAICEAYRGRPARLARSHRVGAATGRHTPRSRAQITPTHPDHATTHPNPQQHRTTGCSRHLLGHSASGVRYIRRATCPVGLPADNSHWALF